MRGAIGDGKSRGGGEIHGRGQDEGVGFARQGLLGEAAAVQHREHAIARPDALRAHADRPDMTRGLETRGERRHRSFLVFAGRHQEIGEVDPGGGDVDKNLSRTRRCGRRDIDKGEVVDLAPGLTLNRPHDRRL